MRRASLSALIALALLAACAPATEGERLQVVELSEEVGYYPGQTGATWEYLPNNALLEEVPVVRRVEGPTVIDGDLWVASRLVGRGFDIRHYRQYRDDGVYILRREFPGTRVTFDPPIREFPEEGALRVGATWSGQTKAEIFFPEASAENQLRILTLDYRYTVVDRRTVTLVSGVFEVFVIDFVTRTLDDEGEMLEELTQETWFTPFVGEVRTADEFFLVSTNFLESGLEAE